MLLVSIVLQEMCYGMFTLVRCLSGDASEAPVTLGRQLLAEVQATLTVWLGHISLSDDTLIDPSC